jgi:uncharacterized SAM-binding protein YcdF (DUF218 family)
MVTGGVAARYAAGAIHLLECTIFQPREEVPRMRIAITDIVHVFLVLPVYVLALLAVLAAAAFRQEAASTLRRWRYVFVVALAAVYVMTAPVFAEALVRTIEYQYSPPVLTASARNRDNLIVVLTAGWLRSAENHSYEVKLGEAGWERTWIAVELWQRIGGKLLFVGAPTPDGKISAAAGMARVARQLGVPSASLLVEGNSRNTYENWKFSERLIQQYGDRVWLITSAINMPRAMSVARGLGINAVPYPCDYRADKDVSWRLWIPSNAAPVTLEEALHELLGMVWYRWRGWM